MIEIWLPFPRGLSVNGARRASRQTRTGHEAADRGEAREICARLLGPSTVAEFAGEFDLECWVTVYPPDARKRDVWNVPFAMKAAMDGVCEALGINDIRLNPAHFSRGEVGKRGPGGLPGAVRVVIERHSEIHST